MGKVIECDRIATYSGPSGQASTYPLREGMEAPASLTMRSGEVRTLALISYYETDAPADPLNVVTEMAVAA